MSAKFRTVSLKSCNENVFKLFHQDWMLVTAGTLDSFNMLTASWGGLGILWETEVAMCVIRPTRHTFGFMEKSDTFTLSFFDEKYRKALKFCGKKSGKYVDKAKMAGLTPVKGRDGGIYFEEARMVFECRKLYWSDMDPAHFCNPKLDNYYPEKDYHRIYYGKILTCYLR